MKTHPNITQKSKVWFTNELKPWLNSLTTYSFDKLEYLNNTSKVVVTCKRHGDIETIMKVFRENHKCRKCSNEENFLTKMSNKYKEYDFKDTVFTNSRSKVTVKCLIHESPFTVNANKLAQGKLKCPKCSTQTFTKEEFVLKSKNSQLVNYDYTESNYINSGSYVTIFCTKHNSMFTQKAGAHMAGRIGCTYCEEDITLVKSIKEFFENTKNIHNNRYIYSNVEYRNSKTPISITCRVHGEFYQTPNSHLRGSGCPKCASISKHRKKLKTDFIKIVKEKYGHLYDYSKTKYTGLNNNINVMCKTHNAEFIQGAKNHEKGLTGCRLCQPIQGINLNKPCILYYFQIKDGFKIGITTVDLIGRYSIREVSNFKNIYVKFFIKGHFARQEEKRILTKFKKFQYKGKKLLSTGNTELFNKDVIQNKGDWWKHNYSKEESKVKLEL